MNSPLLEEIDAALRKHERLAPLDYYLAETLSWLAVVSSVFAGLSVSNKWLTDPATAILAVVPALAWTLLRTFQYEARSNWHYHYRARLLTLKRALRDQGEGADAVSRRLGELDLEMQSRFPKREAGGHAVPASVRETR